MQNPEILLLMILLRTQVILSLISYGIYPGLSRAVWAPFTLPE
jgi:hypothetical protein